MLERLDEFGVQLKQARKAAGLTQRELAERVRQTVPGSRCTLVLVSFWETGKRRPSPAMRKALRDILPDLLPDFSLQDLTPKE
jgi:transcriptional regulator with XRE-family HTH domain